MDKNLASILKSAGWSTGFGISWLFFALASFFALWGCFFLQSIWSRKSSCHRLSWELSQSEPRTAHGHVLPVAFFGRGCCNHYPLWTVLSFLVMVGNQQIATNQGCVFNTAAATGFARGDRDQGQNAGEGGCS